LLLAAAVAATSIVLLWFAARRATTVCVLEIRDGRVEVASGGIAPGVLADIGDVVRRPRTQRATVRITREGGRAALAMHGDLSPAQQQQLRNVVGTVPLQRLARR